MRSLSYEIEFDDEEEEKTKHDAKIHSIESRM